MFKCLFSLIVNFTQIIIRKNRTDNFRKCFKPFCTSNLDHKNVRGKMLTISVLNDALVNFLIRAGGANGAGGNLPPDFGTSLNPILTRGTDYAHRITTCPPPSGFSDLPPTLLIYLLGKEEEAYCAKSFYVDCHLLRHEICGRSKLFGIFIHFCLLNRYYCSTFDRIVKVSTQ